jgi:hypothetical protein
MPGLPRKLQQIMDLGLRQPHRPVTARRSHQFELERDIALSSRLCCAQRQNRRNALSRRLTVAAFNASRCRR